MNTLLYTPCVAAVATVGREMGGIKAAALLVIYAGDSVYSAKYPNTGIGITECSANEKIDYCSIMPIIKN